MATIIIKKAFNTVRIEGDFNKDSSSTLGTSMDSLFTLDHKAWKGTVGMEVVQCFDVLFSICDCCRVYDDASCLHCCCAYLLSISSPSALFIYHDLFLSTFLSPS